MVASRNGRRLSQCAHHNTRLPLPMRIRPAPRTLTALLSPRCQSHHPTFANMKPWHSQLEARAPNGRPGSESSLQWFDSPNRGGKTNLAVSLDARQALWTGRANRLHTLPHSQRMGQQTRKLIQDNSRPIFLSREVEWNLPEGTLEEIPTPLPGVAPQTPRASTPIRLGDLGLHVASAQQLTATYFRSLGYGPPAKPVTAVTSLRLRDCQS